jgi:hypothetical protein
VLPRSAPPSPRPIEAFFPKQWFKVKGGKPIASLQKKEFPFKIFIRLQGNSFLAEKVKRKAKKENF